jgi:hypothetical protein
MARISDDRVRLLRMRSQEAEAKDIGRFLGLNVLFAVDRRKT